jgi:hypothetical protein
MAAKSERPAPNLGSPGSHDPPGPDGVSDPDQQYGPLELERHRKADGRALILYSLAGGSARADA